MLSAAEPIRLGRVARRGRRVGILAMAGRRAAGAEVIVMGGRRWYPARVGKIRSIAVLFHERQRDVEQGNYRIWALAENWRARGIRVEYVWGIRREIDADLLFPHLDVSYIPDDYWAFLQRHPNVVNRRVRDIRKTAVSGLRVGPDDPVEGPVIVKTVDNCGGYTDDWLRGPSLWRRARRRICRVPWVERRTLPWARALSRYYLFDSVREVPRGVFRNPNLIVERFMPERDGDQYIVRLWIVLGDRWLGRVLASRDPQVKSGNSRLDEGVAPPPEIVAWRERFGLDYGKIDYVIHQGRPIVLDVNTTPTVSGDGRSEFYIRGSADLSEGIGVFEHGGHGPEARLAPGAAMGTDGPLSVTRAG